MIREVPVKLFEIFLKPKALVTYFKNNRVNRSVPDTETAVKYFYAPDITHRQLLEENVRNSGQWLSLREK